MSRITRILPSSFVPRSLSVLATGAAVMYYYDPKNGKIRRQRVTRYLDEFLASAGEDWEQAKSEIQDALDSQRFANGSSGNGRAKAEMVKGQPDSSALPRVAARCLMGYAGLKSLPHLSFNTIAFLAATTSFMLPTYAQLKERAEIDVEPQRRIE